MYITKSSASFGMRNDILHSSNNKIYEKSLDTPYNIIVNSILPVPWLI